MNRYKLGIRITLAITATLLLGIGVGVMLERTSRTQQKIQIIQGDKLSWTLSLLEQRYVDSLSRDSLVEKLVPDLLKELDPHSVYITKDEFASANEPLAGQFDGIGVMFNMMTDTVLVTNVIAGGPSSKAGVIAGDKIIKINDSIVAGRKIDQEDVVKQLRGKRGSNVKIGVERGKGRELINIDITRGVIPMKSLEASVMMPEKTGYVKFSRFAATTYKELMEALSKLSSQQMQRLIIDLRGNSGGYLDQAIYISNEFLPKGNKIVYTEGVHSPRSDQNADGQGRYQNLPLVILIDENSASAAEILAGAIQDNDRGTIIGRRSFGKGLVQEQFPFADGSAARITIARYYTPLGRLIQKPYVVGNSDEYNKDIVRRIEHSELFSSDSIHQNQSEKFITSKGRILYGGGGIMPDEFVPLDTSAVSTYFRKLFEKNLIFKYATQFTENNRSQINAIKDFEGLQKLLSSRNLFFDFVAYADRNGVQLPADGAVADRALIMAQLQGYIGRNTELEESAFYFYFYPQDKTILKALSSFNEK